MVILLNIKNNSLVFQPVDLGAEALGKKNSIWKEYNIMALGDIKVIRKVGGQDIRPPSGETWLILGITGDDSGAPSSGQVSFEDEVVAWISEESNFVDRAVSLFDKIGVNDTGFSNDYIFYR